MQNINILFAFIQVATAGVGATDVGIFGYCRTDFSKHIVQQPPLTHTQTQREVKTKTDEKIILSLFCYSWWLFAH